MYSPKRLPLFNKKMFRVAIKLPSQMGTNLGFAFADVECVIPF
jgi:hypothetical protein